MATPTTLPASFTAGEVLTAAQMNNLRGAFRVLQVVSGSTETSVSSSTNTLVDTGLTATITPTSTSSKVLVCVMQNGCKKATNNTAVRLVVLRGASIVVTLATVGGDTGSTATNNFGTIAGMYLDSPATTSATTYKTQFSSVASTASVTVQDQGNSQIILLEVSA